MSGSQFGIIGLARRPNSARSPDHSNHNLGHRDVHHFPFLPLDRAFGRF